jgi:hypothetical protein
MGIMGKRFVSDLSFVVTIYDFLWAGMLDSGRVRGLRDLRI